MVLKNLLMFLILGVVATMPATVLAWNNWDGNAVDNVWANPLNWSPAPGTTSPDVLPTNEFVTEEARIGLDSNGLPDSIIPVIADGNFTEWDRGRNKGGTLIQTGGLHRWRNFTSTNGFAIFKGTAEFNISGGQHYVDQLVLGDDMFTTQAIWDAHNLNPITTPSDGTGTINLTGTGTYVVEPNTWDGEEADPLNPLGGRHHLWIFDGSKIDIRDNGALRVPTDMVTEIDDYITAGKILAGTGGDTLTASVIGSEYVVWANQLPGDFDVDHDVDGADFLAWQRGESPNGATAGDLAEWKANFGGPGPAVAAVTAAVPEPASAMLALLGLGLFAGSRRRQKCCS